MKNKVFLLHTNYQDYCKKFLKHSADYIYSPMRSYDALKKQLDLDVVRSVFLSRTHSLEEIQTRVAPQNPEQAGLSLAYSQGNFTGEILTEAAIGPTFAARHSMNDALLINLSKNHGCLNFGFIDKKGRPCGFSLSYNKLSPDFFNICYIRNTVSKDPKKRKVVIVEGTNCPEESNHAWPPQYEVGMDEPLTFPGLKQLANDAYDEGELIDRNNIRKIFLSIISDLTEEAKYCIRDIIQENGHLNIAAIERLKLSPLTNNEDVKFLSEDPVFLIQNELVLLEEKARELFSRGEAGAGNALSVFIQTEREHLSEFEENKDFNMLLQKTETNINTAKSTVLRNPRGLGAILDGFYAFLEGMARFFCLHKTAENIKIQGENRHTDSIAKLGVFKDRLKQMQPDTEVQDDEVLVLS